jgi:uncharacterized hydrophobic protein (TIGR00271 family)
MEADLFQQIKKIINYRFNLDDDKASEIDVLAAIKKAIEFKGINLWTLIFAIFIASIGLNVNSTAVIIGAMLISPLMGPIMGIGFGAGVFDFDLIKKASKNLIIATLIGLLTSTLYFFISPLNTAQSELLARTSPTIWDVLIAFFGGMAGIVAISRKKYNNVIPGVAIATALMPPLCTAGYGLASGQWNFFFGAFYLYLINSVFISISTFLIIRFLKFKPVSYVDSKTTIKIKKWIITIALLTIIPSLYLAYVFVKNEIFIKKASNLITEEIISADYTLINKKIIPEDKTISITVIGNRSTDSLKQLLEVKRNKYSLQDAKIIIKNGISEGNNIPNINELKEGIIEEIISNQENKLKEKNEEIKNLKNLILEQNKFSLKRDEAIKEFQVLFGSPKELIIEKSINYSSDKLDTILIVYFKNLPEENKNVDLIKLKKWINIKFGSKNIKIVEDRK